MHLCKKGREIRNCTTILTNCSHRHNLLRRLKTHKQNKIHLLRSNDGFRPSRRENIARMIIPINRGEGKLEEWVIIEMQGDLKNPSGNNRKPQLIGDLHFTESGIPILVIGIHVLYGKEITLKKPFAVLEKVCRNKDCDSKNVEAENDGATSEITVKAVIKKKLIFKGRPKPIVTDVPIFA